MPSLWILDNFREDWNCFGVCVVGSRHREDYKLSLEAGALGCSMTRVNGTIIMKWNTIVGNLEHVSTRSRVML